jgi:uncharacterized protein YqhQ
MSEKKMQVGGQAVIEGVMMRSPHTYSVAVRRQDGTIFVRKRPFTSFIRKHKFLSLPLLRGAIVLIESIVLGVQSLTFSGDVAMEDEKRKENPEAQNDNSGTVQRGLLAKIWLGMTVLFSFAVGLFIFFYVPLILTDWLGAESGFTFNLVDGILRLAIFLLYLFLITLMKDIRRIFEYHGAEHKSIFAFENKKTLTPAVAKTFTRFHPRCGTSFLLFVMIVSIVVFVFLGKPETVGDRLIRLAFIPLIGGVSYELIRLSEIGAKMSIWRPFIVPGLWLQKLTTKEPDESQLEVAIVALKCALNLDLTGHNNVVLEGHDNIQVVNSE